MEVEQRYKGMAAMGSLIESARKRKLRVHLVHEPERRPDVSPREPQGDVVLLVGHPPLKDEANELVRDSINRTDLATACEQTQRRIEDLFP